MEDQNIFFVGNFEIYDQKPECSFLFSYESISLFFSLSLVKMVFSLSRPAYLCTRDDFPVFLAGIIPFNLVSIFLPLS